MSQQMIRFGPTLTHRFSDRTTQSLRQTGIGLKLVIARALLVLGCMTPVLLADTVYYGTGAERKILAERVIIREVLSNPELVMYWQQQKGLKSGSCKSTICEGVKSSNEERLALIDSWKGNGTTAKITDQNGQSFVVYDLRLRFVAPPELLCTGCFDATGTEAIIVGSAGSASILRFDSVSRIDFTSPSNLSITLADGTRRNGPLGLQTVPIVHHDPLSLRAQFIAWQQLDSANVTEFTIYAEDIKVISIREASTVPTRPDAPPFHGGSLSEGLSATRFVLFSPLFDAPVLGPKETDRIRKEVEAIEASHRYSTIPAAQAVAPTGPVTSGMVHHRIDNATPFSLTVQITGSVNQEVILPSGTSRAMTIPIGVYKMAAHVPADVLPYFGTQIYEADHDYQSHFYIEENVFRIR